ncbi:MAG: type II secretion system F family protein [Patescibacteria group bacterium]|nr:type II secretion system F family protein [Patescibacteria group bacterium]
MQFFYKALKENKIISGKIEADEENQVVNYLKKEGFFPIEIKNNNNFVSDLFDHFFKHVSFNDIVDLTRQLAIMLNAGLNLVDCFDILKKQTSKRSLYKLIDDIDKDIKSGLSFSSALKKYPQYFSNLYIALVRSGEASGKLAEILLKLADNLEKQREFHGKIKSALIYPVIVISGMIIVMFIMITFVIPRLLNLYRDFNISLPLSTQILITISSFMTKFWPIIIIGFFLSFIFTQRYFKTKPGKFLLDSTILKIPVINNLIKISSLVDSTRTLSILIGAGVSIIEGLEIIIDTTNNIIYQNAFRNIYKQVEKGVSLGTAFKNEGIFPPILVQMTIVGEQTGHLDETLARISRYFEMQSELAIKTATTLIEPAILIFLGLGVGFLVTSVITPIYQLTSSFK